MGMECVGLPDLGSHIAVTRDLIEEKVRTMIPAPLSASLGTFNLHDSTVHDTLVEV